MATLIEKAVGSLEDKRRWRAHRARVRALPSAYRAAAEAVERYTVHLGALTTGELPTGPLMAMLDDVADRFERAAASGAPVGEVVDGDATRFAETLVALHLGARWNAEPAQGTTAVERDVHRHLGDEIAKERRRMLVAFGRPEA